MRNYIEEYKEFMNQEIGEYDVTVEKNNKYEKADETQMDIGKSTGKRLVKMLKESKIFQVDKDIAESLWITDNKIFERKLPFPTIFISSKIKTEEGGYFNGFLISEIKRERANTAVPEHLKGYVIIPKKGDIAIETHYYFRGGALFIDIPFFASNKKQDVEHQKKDLIKKIRVFIANFIDFLDEPDVKIVEIKRGTHNEKRIIRGKIPMPPSCSVRITGKLKKYMDSMKTGRHFTYGHRFWVRGHWHHYYHPKWKAKVGTRRWIPPYVKGNGMLFNKYYVLDKGV